MATGLLVYYAICQLPDNYAKHFIYCKRKNYLVKIFL